MIKWEYKLCVITDNEELNKLGSDGWELISAINGEAPEVGAFLQCILKRGKSDPPHVEMRGINQDLQNQVNNQGDIGYDKSY